MTLHLGLGELGQARRLATGHARRDQAPRLAHGLLRRGLGLGKHLGAPAGMAELHDQRLVPDGRVIPAQSVLLSHLPTASFSTAARRSISSLVWISVTQ